MSHSHAIVVTTINAPTPALVELAAHAPELDAAFVVVGDSKSPPGFDLPGARFLDVAAQQATGLKFAEACPTRHYARKNVGYLVAMREGASVIVETDDDNIPQAGFWSPRVRSQRAPTVTEKGWCNAYAYYADGVIWPRGLPLDRIHHQPQPFASLPVQMADCPIQQGLADENPDVDAIYRLVLPLPVSFAAERTLILGEGVWCPFNSQNTTFWRDAFPLLYLPFHCSFRMTDIWRSFVAQRLAWDCGWRLQFHSSTVVQERNEHDLTRDFADEVPGYLNNERIRRALEDLPITGGVGALARDLTAAYDALIALEVVGSEERALLAAWLRDLDDLGVA